LPETASFFAAPYSWIIFAIIPRTSNPDYFLALRAVGIELGMPIILPHPLAVGTSKLDHLQGDILIIVFMMIPSELLIGS
jgi:hypothetical protein